MVGPVGELGGLDQGGRLCQGVLDAVAGEVEGGLGEDGGGGHGRGRADAIVRGGRRRRVSGLR